MKLLIYIAGPFTYPDQSENTHIAVKFGNEIYDTNLALPFVPHLSLFENYLKPRPISYYYDKDIEYLEHCQGLIRMVGTSIGADNEVRFCNENDIPVFKLRRNEVSDELREWMEKL